MRKVGYESWRALVIVAAVLVVTLTADLAPAPPPEMVVDDTSAVRPTPAQTTTAYWISTTFIVIGLFANLVGVFLLFRYGMPYRVPATNGDYIVTEQTDPEGLQTDARYRLFGKFGLALIVLGTGSQVVGAIF